MSRLSLYFFLLICFTFPLCRSTVKKTESLETPEPLPFLRKDVQEKFPSIAFPPRVAAFPKGGTDKIKKILRPRYDSRGRAVTLTISGGELIRKEFIRKGKPLVRIVLKRNAKLYHNQIRIRAQKIIIENEERGKMFGNIEIYDPQTKTRVYGQRAVYERNKQKIRLWGNPYLQKNFSDSKQKRLRITCQSLDYLLKEKHLLLKNDVRAHYGDVNMLAEKGKYLASQQKLILETNPTFLSPEAYLVGKTLIFDEQKKNFELNGESVLYWYASLSLSPFSQSKPEEKKRSAGLPSLENYVSKTIPAKHPSTIVKLERESPPSSVREREKPKIPSSDTEAQRKELSILTANRLGYEHYGSVKAQGNVLLTQPNLYFQADRVHLFGEKAKNISAKGNIYAIDHRSKMEMKAQKLQYIDSLQKLILKKRASLYFYGDPNFQEPSQKQSKTLTRFFGDYIERDFAKKRTQAQGKVKLSQKDYQAKGGLANYYEDAELLIMQGNPEVYKDKTFMRADKIFIYLQKERILFQNHVQAGFQ